MDLELGGLRALVTGGSRGIGRGIAARLAAEGAAVAVCARDGAAAAEAGEALGGFGMAADVTSEDDLQRFVAVAAQRLGGVDLVVANAGGASGGAPLEEADAAAWSQTMAVNVVHAPALIRASLGHLERSAHAAALIISSVSGLRPQLRAQYAAAKAAEIHAAAALGRELGPRGIRVNALSPGSILFEGGGWEARRDRDPEAFARWIAAELPHGRLGTVEEVADVAAFLLSPRASWVNGANVVVDGGQGHPNMP
ncbi:SDR family oxidoreductase [Baekduia soli]|uniref:SDR family oxidoreductase n=1 Tax=Baekduia soli TaxID=496014 RepID=A0A5B8U745_9ACTN|nr:SDR family oxidoreductase [Baekduia soli]QEC48751.1 SDR family oxidoreductase [Baekduia soli]